MPTEQLVEQAQRGDRGAFGALYDRFAPALTSVAARILGQRLQQREHDDLVHDVFLEAWQQIRSYDRERGTFRTWLLLRLRSRAWDLLARAETRRTRLVEDDETMHPSTAAPQEHEIEQKAVRTALSALEPGVRSVLELTYFDGLSAREVAERTGLPQGTVKSRLSRGLSVLAAALGEPIGANDD